MSVNNFQHNNKPNLQKFLKIILIIFSIILIIIFQGRIFFNMTNNMLLFLLSILSSSILPTLLMGFIAISVLPIIILRKSNEVKLTSKYIPIIVLIILVIFAFNLNYSAIYPYREYTINGKKVYGMELTFRTLGDIISNETIEIKTNNCEIIHDIRYRNHYTIYDYYLKINEGEYIIPIGSASKVRGLLYQNSYGENSINTITVYKNSKIIKEINGLDLSAEDNEIYEFAYNKSNKINIALQPDNTITYQTVGCTIDEFINNEKIYLCIFDENNNEVFWNNVKDEKTELPTNLKDGKYFAYICTHYMKLEKISNSIVYEIKDKKIYKAEQQD